MKKNLYFAVFIILLSGLYLYATYLLPERRSADPVGPVFFPAMVGILTLVLGISLLLQSMGEMLQAEAGAGSSNDTDAGGDPRNLQTKQFVAACCVLAWTLLFYFTLNWTGYILGSLIFLFGMFSFFHRGKHFINALVAIAYTGVIYVVFAKLLGISLPEGLIYF